MSNPRNRYGLTIVFALLAFHPLLAQETDQSEREAMYHRYLDFSSYVKGGTVEPHWLADGSSFWYAEGEPENTVIWKVDPEANTRTRLSVAPDTPSAELERLAPRPGEVPSPDGRWIATVRDYNLWLKSTDDGTERQLTSDGIPDYEWSLGSSPLSGQDVMQWSPNGSMLAIKKSDYRQTPKVPLVNWLGPREEVDWAGFDRKPGQPIRRSELFLIGVPSGERVRVDVAEHPDQRIHLVQWLPDGSELLFFARRDYHPDLALMAADARTGSARSILVEERPVRFRTSGPYPEETPLTLVENGKQFLWVSGRTGWRHLYLYDLAGNLIRPLTQGEFPVERVVRVDERTGWVYFTARDDATRPYDTHLYRVDLAGNGLTRLTESPGQHEIRFAPSGRFFLDTHSSVDRPPTVELRRADGTLLQTVATADVSALDELRYAPPEEFAVKAADGTTDLFGVLYKPFDFTPDRKYPVILFAFGREPRTFAPGLAAGPYSTAQLGFIVFWVNVREPALSWRGGEFDRVTAGTIGRYEVPDYVAALQGLAAERPYMDLSRVGVWGGSYGGYHAIRAMLQAPDHFHVGIAVAAITDAYGHPNFYLLGSPEENREAYEEASNLPLAGNLKGKLLLVHGTHDTSVPFSHVMRMVDALTRAGKPYDLIVLPGWGHWWPDTEAWERYRSEAYRRYFQEHLKP